MDRRAVGVVDTDLGFNNFVNEVFKNQKVEILVGIQEGSYTKAQSKNGNIQPAGVSIAQYGAYNEFGTEKIPARSFIRSTMIENDRRIQNLVELQIKMAIDGKFSIDVALNRIGIAVSGMIQKKIREIVTPPNAESTILKKKSSKPLIDFGQMIASIRHIVRKTDNLNADE